MLMNNIILIKKILFFFLSHSEVIEQKNNGIFRSDDCLPMVSG